MRLDKFLKLSRIIKRRSLAKEVADKGRVTVNGNSAKAATKLAVGDELIIQFGQKVVTFQILDLREHVTKEEATSLYKVIREERIEE